MGGPGPRDIDGAEELPEPPPLRRLRWLVSALTAVLILGMVVVSATLVIRLTRAPGAAPVTADEIALPAGHAVVALGQGEGTLILLTRAPEGAEVLRVFDAGTGAPLSETRVRRSPASGGDDPAGG